MLITSYHFSLGEWQSGNVAWGVPDSDKVATRLIGEEQVLLIKRHILPPSKLLQNSDPVIGAVLNCNSNEVPNRSCDTSNVHVPTGLNNPLVILTSVMNKHSRHSTASHKTIHSGKNLHYNIFLSLTIFTGCILLCAPDIYLHTLYSSPL